MTKIKKPASETEPDPSTPSKERTGITLEELQARWEAMDKRSGREPLSLEEMEQLHSGNISATLIPNLKKPKDE